MSDELHPIDEFESFDESADSASTALLTEETSLPHPEWTGDRCERCQHPLPSRHVTICRTCGWYPLLGTHVEIDPDWEGAVNDEDEAEATATPSTLNAHLKVWADLLPRWSWWIIGTVLGVVVESVLVRLLTGSGSALRTVWSLTQLAIGVGVFAGCHLFNFITVAAEDSDTGIVDIVIKPLKHWIRTCQNLPERLWRVCAAAGGLTAVVMSLAVIGGIPYERLWDWGVEPPPKQNLMGAVMSQVQKVQPKGEKKSLEDAVGEFAGSADGAEESAGLKTGPQIAPPKPRKTTECLILGYQAGEDGRIHTLLLATEYLGRLVYAGRVLPQLSEEELQELSSKLAGIKTDKRLLPIQTEAKWVQPKYTCKVSFTKQGNKGQLHDIRWEKMAGEFKF